MSCGFGETFINIRNYGGGNGIDDDSALAELLFATNPGCTLFFPRGEYRLDTTLNIPAGNGNAIKGEGRYSKLIVSAADITGVLFSGTGNVGIGASDFLIDRIDCKQSAGYGLDIPGVTGQSAVRNVVSMNHWRGIGLGPCSFGWFEGCVASTNYSHGIHVRNAPSLPFASLQWVNNNNLVEKNDGAGCLYEAVAHAEIATVSTGTISNLSAFANTIYGFGAAGTATTSIEGIRLNNCFLGQDGIADVYLGTYGQQHMISGGFYELCGSGFTGRKMATPSNHAGVGIQINQNNGMTNIHGAHISGHQRAGVMSEAEYLQMTGCTVVNNGQSLAPGQLAGIYHLDGVMNVTGGIVRNVRQCTSQEYGIITTEGSALTVIGVDLRGNKVSGLYGVNRHLATMVGCPGMNTLIPTGGIALCSPAGGVVAAGTINASAGMLKNGVGYTNP